MHQTPINTLLATAHSLGATATTLIPAETLVVEDRFAAMCAVPHRCPSFGLAPGCPPHAMPPSLFRKLLQRYHQILVFKIDAPIAALMGAERPALTRSIHVIAAGVEQQAERLGLAGAMGLAAGSCKELFCTQEEVCAVLEHHLTCPHAHLARPSLSALGVNFSALAKSAGWPFNRIGEQAKPSGEPAMGLMAGLVLLPSMPAI